MGERYATRTDFEQLYTRYVDETNEQIALNE